MVHNRPSLETTMSGVVPTISNLINVRRGGIADDVDYEIRGVEMQFVEIELDPGESAIAEAGSLMFKDAVIGMDTVFGDGSKQPPAAGASSANSDRPRAASSLARACSSRFFRIKARRPAARPASPLPRPIRARSSR